jgi:hypothetical protein
LLSKIRDKIGKNRVFHGIVAGVSCAVITAGVIGTTPGCGKMEEIRDSRALVAKVYDSKLPYNTA